MGYVLNEEQRDIVKMVADFASNEIKPRCAEWDVSGEFPMDLYKMAFEMGLHCMEIPEEFGGGGIDYYTTSACYEELAKADAGFAVSIAATGLSLKPILLYGTDAQKKMYADVICPGGWGAFALTEPEAGSDVASGKTTAKLVGDEYIINGRKCFITNAGVADIFVVFATVDRSLGHKGLTAFIVKADTPGITTGHEENKMGIRGSNTCDVVFEDVHVPVENMLGKVGQGFKIAMDTLDLARPFVGSMAVGIAQRSMEEAIAYAKLRKTFGKPIIANQAIQFKLADMDIKIETARNSVIGCLNNYYAGLPYAREAAIAKCYAADISVECALESIQILGGYGYSREYPVEKLLRDAKIFQIFEGTNEVQRIVVFGQLSKKYQ